MPWSWAAGTKCVWTRPLVEAPQIAKVPASSQNGPVRAALTRTVRVRRAAPVTGAGLGTYARRPVRREAHVRRVVAQQQPHEGDDGERGQGHGDGGRAPAVGLDHPGEQRQEDQLAGGGGRGQDAGDQAAALGEPAVGDGRGERERHRAAAEARPTAPQYRTSCQAACMNTVSPEPDRDHGQGDGDDLADAEAVHQRGGEGRGQAVEREVHGDRGADRAARPVELAVQRVDEQSGQRAEGGGADDRDEGDGRHGPGAVDPGLGLRGAARALRAGWLSGSRHSASPVRDVRYEWPERSPFAGIGPGIPGRAGMPRAGPACAHRTAAPPTPPMERRMHARPHPPPRRGPRPRRAAPLRTRHPAADIRPRERTRRAGRCTRW